MTFRLLTDHHIQEIDQALACVPEHLRGGLRRYLVDRERPGQFLVSILSNDLVEAVRRADDASYAALRDIVDVLYFVAPPRAWGSPAAVRLWLDSGKRTAKVAA